MKVSTVEEMRQMDRRAIHDFGIPAFILMENAGQAVYYLIHNEFGVRDKRFVIICGLGHNGGDGLVAARKILSSHGKAKIFILGDANKYDEAPRMNYEMLTRCGAEMEVQPSTDTVAAALKECDAVVDALLGTGILRDVKGHYKEVIELINRSAKTVFSVDIPSGVDGNTGRIRGCAVQADYTVTFGLPKRGNLLFPGAGLGGRLFVTHISFPTSLQNTETIAAAVNVPAPLPKHTIEGNKGARGKGLFIAPSAGSFNAPAFAAQSLLKCGGRCARLALPRSALPFAASAGSEILLVPQEETESGSLSISNADPLLKLSEDADFVVLGSGPGPAEETHELLRRITGEIEKPLLIDGGGLTAIVKDFEVVKKRTAPTILTLHADEMSKICGLETSDVIAEPIGALQRTAKDLDAVVVLKSDRSLVGFPDEKVFINTSGKSPMAATGSRNVLAGAIAAMNVLGLPPGEGVKTGVFIHGFAEDLAVRDKGGDGVTLHDILEHLPSAVKILRENYAEAIRDFYGTVRIL
jgi:hydroxyethylthiazole kinase-like uncharacterized protein yjeF